MGSSWFWDVTPPVITCSMLFFPLGEDRSTAWRKWTSDSTWLMLLEDCTDTGRTVTTDNWFTSLPLTNALREVGMNIVDTIKKKPYIPTIMNEVSKTRKTRTTAFLFHRGYIDFLQGQERQSSNINISWLHFHWLVTRTNPLSSSITINMKVGLVLLINYVLTIHAVDRHDGGLFVSFLEYSTLPVWTLTSFKWQMYQGRHSKPVKEGVHENTGPWTYQAMGP